MGGWQRRGKPSGAELAAWLAADVRRVAVEHSPANLGCRCGPGGLGEDGLIGADADGERGVVQLAPHPGLAAGTLAAAAAEYRQNGTFRPALGTAAYLTQSGGLRVLWRTAPGGTLRTVGADQGHQGLRLMWQGAQAVLPDSIGPDGAYRWLPGHSPWQVGFGDAPASVLAAMSGRRATANSGGVAAPPVAAYPACRGPLGPSRDGRMVHAGSLPYDQGLLRDGVRQGERSEAVLRLELQMLAAGWSVEQVVSALAGQPWIRAMRRNIVGWLTADVLRAVAWRAEQTARAAGGDEQRSYKPRDNRRPTPPGRSVDVPALAEALARRVSEPGFELDEAVAVAVADASAPGRLEAELRAAVATARAGWPAGLAAEGSSGQTPASEPGRGTAATDGEVPGTSSAQGRKRRGPPAGAAVVSPTEGEIRRWLTAPKGSTQRGDDHSGTVRLSASVRLGTLWVEHPGTEPRSHAVLGLRSFILRSPLLPARVTVYEKGVLVVHQVPPDAHDDGRSYSRRGCAEHVSRRLALHLQRLGEGPRYCGREAVFREAPACNSSGALFHVHHATHAPCGQRGCRRCAEVVAATELAEHAERLRMIYGDEPVAVLHCSTRGFGLPAAQAAARKLLKNRAVREAVGGPGVLCGYLCGGAQDGRIAYGLLLPEGRPCAGLAA